MWVTVMQCVPAGLDDAFAVKQEYQTKQLNALRDVVRFWADTPDADQSRVFNTLDWLTQLPPVLQALQQSMRADLPQNHDVQVRWQVAF